jgi:hypothetical protein
MLRKSRVIGESETSSTSNEFWSRERVRRVCVKYYRDKPRGDQWGGND